MCRQRFQPSASSLKPDLTPQHQESCRNVRKVGLAVITKLVIVVLRNGEDMLSSNVHHMHPFLVYIFDVPPIVFRRKFLELVESAQQWPDSQLVAPKAG